jgi:hypothetical protein
MYDAAMTSPCTVNGVIWMTKTGHGGNRSTQQDRDRQWWLCDGEEIRPLDDRAQIPTDESHYKTTSAYIFEGVREILRGNAVTTSVKGEQWLPIILRSSDDGKSAYLTTRKWWVPEEECNQATVNTSADWGWMEMIGLTKWHNYRQLSKDPTIGGLKGPLSLFPVLIALSVPATDVAGLLPNLLRGGGG